MVVTTTRRREWTYHLQQWFLSLMTHSIDRRTKIQECEDEEEEQQRSEYMDCTDVGVTKTHKHQPTPLHHKNDKYRNKKRHDQSGDSSSSPSSDGSVSCNKCRPHNRERISVVPLDNHHGTAASNNGVNKTPSFNISSPNTMFKSFLHSLTRKSPKSTDKPSASEEHWKIAVAELSHKLIQATRKRDEALLEASRLKYSMTELEKKLNKLELYCHSLKSGLEECSSGTSPYKLEKNQNIHHRQVLKNQDQIIIEKFLASVSESRSSVRLLSRSLIMQLKHMGAKSYERISFLLQPYDIKIPFSKNPKSILFYLEALINRAFFEDFESTGFEKNATNPILNPIERCEANTASFNALKELTWEEVLSKGTKHFSEEFSRFCDRKMSEIVAMLGWNRAWPEPLLQAFFMASKNVWLVHLLANSVHPGLQIFRVEKETRFDSVYMEEMGGDRARVLVPTIVRIMVAPGFYVSGSVVKCKVLCNYYNYKNNYNDNNNCIKS